MKRISFIIATTICLFVALVPTKALTCEWRKIGGKLYWYEDGVRQGTPGDPKNIIDKIYGVERGREIYDPKSDAWYWLDADANGAKAESKDVWLPYIYQDERPGSTEGKWVRYDDKGRMVKGVQYYEKNGSWYKFDVITGAMLKGWHKTSSGSYVFYDKKTGKLKEYDFSKDGFDYVVDYETAHVTGCTPSSAVIAYKADDEYSQLDCALAMVQKYLGNEENRPNYVAQYNFQENVKKSTKALADKFGYDYATFASVESFVSALCRGMFVVIEADEARYAENNYIRTTYVLVGYNNGNTNVYNMETGAKQTVNVRKIFESKYPGITGVLGILGNNWNDVLAASLGKK